MNIQPKPAVNQQGVFRGPGETPIVIDNGNFYVVPAPPAVTIDGDIGDWDLSCAYGPHYVDPALKDQYNITWAAMYDRDALYLGAIFKSARPFENDGGVFGNADVQGSGPRGIGHSSHLSDVYVYRLDRDGNLLWRAGKKASGIAKPGEFYGRACGLGGPLAGQYVSFVDENGQDQRWYVVAGGGGFASIWEIAGLDKITRLQNGLLHLRVGRQFSQGVSFVRPEFLPGFPGQARIVLRIVLSAGSAGCPSVLSTAGTCVPKADPMAAAMAFQTSAQAAAAAFFMRSAVALGASSVSPAKRRLPTTATLKAQSGLRPLTGSLVSVPRG